MIDSKIHNFSILPAGKMKIKTIDEIKIEGFQNFEQYKKINLIDIQINDSEIQTKLLFYSKGYKYIFIANSLLFSSAIKKDTKTIFITKNGLNDAKDILSGVIYISEIKNWDKIKNESHRTNVILTDSTFPTAAKHFAFAFEMEYLDNLLNFEYSLIADKGTLLEFADGEDKIPALNFTIQVI